MLSQPEIYNIFISLSRDEIWRILESYLLVFFSFSFLAI